MQPSNKRRKNNDGSAKNSNFTSRNDEIDRNSCTNLSESALLELQSSHSTSSTTSAAPTATNASSAQMRALEKVMRERELGIISSSSSRLNDGQRQLQNEVVDQPQRIPNNASIASVDLTQQRTAARLTMQLPAITSATEANSVLDPRGLVGYHHQNSVQNSDRRLLLLQQRQEEHRRLQTERDLLQSRLRLQQLEQELEMQTAQIQLQQQRSSVGASSPSETFRSSIPAAATLEQQLRLQQPTSTRRNIGTHNLSELNQLRQNQHAFHQQQPLSAALSDHLSSPSARSRQLRESMLLQEQLGGYSTEGNSQIRPSIMEAEEVHRRRLVDLEIQQMQRRTRLGPDNMGNSDSISSSPPSPRRMMQRQHRPSINSAASVEDRLLLQHQRQHEQDEILLRAAAASSARRNRNLASSNSNRSLVMGMNNNNNDKITASNDHQQLASPSSSRKRRPTDDLLFNNSDVATAGEMPLEIESVALPKTPNNPDGIDLSRPQDQASLSDYQLCIRDSLELFTCTPEQAATKAQGRKKKLKVGQVGVRCKHCLALPPNRRGAGSCYFPQKLTGVYQAAQNMSVSHLQVACPAIPTGIRQRLTQLQQISSVGSKAYWVDSCHYLGIIEDENGDGLRFASTKKRSNIDETQSTVSISDGQHNQQLHKSTNEKKDTQNM